MVILVNIFIFTPLKNVGFIALYGSLYLPLKFHSFISFPNLIFYEHQNYD